jgi:hypothetical protein
MPNAPPIKSFEIDANSYKRTLMPSSLSRYSLKEQNNKKIKTSSVQKEILESLDCNSQA